MPLRCSGRDSRGRRPPVDVDHGSTHRRGRRPRRSLGEVAGQQLAATTTASIGASKLQRLHGGADALYPGEAGVVAVAAQPQRADELDARFAVHRDRGGHGSERSDPTVAKSARLLPRPPRHDERVEVAGEHARDARCTVRPMRWSVIGPAGSCTCGSSRRGRPCPPGACASEALRGVLLLALHVVDARAQHGLGLRAFFACERSSCTARRCGVAGESCRTAVATLFTFCPPAPPEWKMSMRTSPSRGPPQRSVDLRHHRHRGRRGVDAPAPPSAARRCTRCTPTRTSCASRRRGRGSRR